ncbi:MAG: hypothetical protein ABEJ40_05850 [Haloarculaceae archaeon]
MTAESDESPEVPVVCPDCGTETRIALDDVAESVERHNEQLHDGEQVAQVDPALADQLRDIVAEELDLV